MQYIRTLGVLFLFMMVSVQPTQVISSSGFDNYPEEAQIQSEVDITDDILTLQSQNVKMELDLASEGELVSITNLLTLQSIEFSGNFDHPFWGVQLMDSVWFDPFSSEDFEYAIDAIGATLNYTIPVESELMNVTLRLQIDTPHPGINFRMQIESLLSLPGIYRVYLPYLSDVTGWASSDEEQIAIPEREGWLISDAISTILGRNHYSQYPGTMSMQFMVLTEPGTGGFLLASLDSSSRHKGIQLYGEHYVYNTIGMNFYHYSDNMRFNQGNNFTMDYWMVLEGYEGNSWAEGAAIYRDWALDQWYVEKGAVKDRDDIPQWLKEIDYQWKGSSYVTGGGGDIVLEGETVDRMGEFPEQLVARGLSGNLLLEWWGWNRDGFDRGYPEYFPARDGNDALQSGIADAHTNDAKVMIYFNGRLVDRDTQTFTDNQQFLTGYEDTVDIEQYGPHLYAGVADPSTEWWQDLIVNLTVVAVRDFGVDIVYLDQIAVAPPKFDYRDVETHPPGSGSWWQEAENQMLSRAQSEIYAVNPDAGIASENILETYLGNVDLSWCYSTSYELAGWFTKGTSIPLFSFVYHKYAIVSGRSDIYPGNTKASAWAISEALMHGYIPGSPTLSLPSRHSIPSQVFSTLSAAYETRKLGEFKFFRDGDLLLPVSWSTSPDTTFTEWEKTMTVPQGIIQGYSSDDGEFAFLFANRGSSTLQYSGSLDALLSESGVNTESLDSISLIQVYTNGVNTANMSPLTEDLNLDVPAYGFTLLWLRSGDFNVTFTTTTEIPPPIPVEFLIIIISVPAVVIVVLVLIRMKKSTAD